MERTVAMMGTRCKGVACAVVVAVRAAAREEAQVEGALVGAKAEKVAARAAMAGRRLEFLQA